VEQRRERLANGGTGLETMTVREGVGYDEWGMMTSYKDTVDRSDAPSVTMVVTWEDGVFDRQGNLEGYKETTRQVAKGLSVGLDNTRTVERSGTTYDGHGLVSGYQERGTDTAQAGMTVTTVRQGTQYDRMGREKGWVSARHEEGSTRDVMGDGEVVESTVDKWTTVVQGGRTYNGVGQLEGYEETSFDGRTLTIDGEERAWVDLTDAQRAGVATGRIRGEEVVTLVAEP